MHQAPEGFGWYCVWPVASHKVLKTCPAIALVGFCHDSRSLHHLLQVWCQFLIFFFNHFWSCLIRDSHLSITKFCQVLSWFVKGWGWSQFMFGGQELLQRNRLPRPQVHLLRWVVLVLCPAWMVGPSSSERFGICFWALSCCHWCIEIWVKSCLRSSKPRGFLAWEAQR